MLFRKINSGAKDFLLFTRLGALLKPIKNYLRFAGNFSELTSWVHRHNKQAGFTDFYHGIRNYEDRLKLYNYVSEKENLKTQAIQYYEFGVAGGNSFRWWLAENNNKNSAFWGFDTFEGLPEAWHYFKKGDMSFAIPEMNDERAQFVKGLFQHTFPGFLKQYIPDERTKVIHLDADLYSSTLFILTSFAPYLKKGDILFFDEFNVANHEFAAWNDFTRSYYTDYEVLGAVNNYYQVAFKYLGTKL